MNKKKFFAFWMALALAASSVLIACGDEKNSSGSGTTAGAEGTVGTEDGTTATTQLTHGVPDTKYDGATIRIITANEAGNGIDVGVLMEEATDKITESVYKRDRAVEKALDVKLSVVAYGSYSEAYNALQLSVDGNSDDFDIACLHTNAAFNIAGEEQLYDLSDYGYLDFDAPWWDANINDQHKIGDKLFLAVGSASVNDLLRTHMILFNSSIFDDYEVAYPYQDVLDKTWTIDKFGEYAVALNKDINGDGAVTMDSTDIFGFASFSWTVGYTLWYGCDGSVISTDDDGYPIVEFDEGKFVEIYEKIYDAVVNSGSNLVSQAELYTDMYNSFTDGRAAMVEACMMHLTHWETFSNMADDYGIVPAPKFDEAQEEYISYAEVVEPAFCIPITAQASPEMLSSVLELLAYEGYYTITPAVYEVSLKGRFARDEQSKAMLDIISGNRTSCLASVFIPSVSIVASLPTLLSNKTENLSSVIASFRDAMKNSLDKAIEVYRK